MKQVTMESVKQRIADLESAGKVVGGLSLSSEFELSCLRELVAVTEQRDALVAENAVILQDRAVILEAFDDTCVDIGMRRGEMAENYPIPETPATDTARAALRAEGVEMAVSHLIEKFNGTGIGVPVMSLEHLARQLRESKGAQK